jgi:hypothetical protein
MDRIQKDFELFHFRNPQVYNILKNLAFRYLKAGRRAGIKHLWEVMRWEMFVQTKDEGEFKLNNNYASRYARLLMKQETALQGFFDTRRAGTELGIMSWKPIMVRPDTSPDETRSTPYELALKEQEGR